MSKKQENMTTYNGFLASKFWRTFLVIVSVFLIFAGPTYVIYGLAMVLSVDLAASFAVGFVLFIAGIGLMWYLLRNKVVS
jgi:hypothetical protein